MRPYSYTRAACSVKTGPTSLPVSLVAANVPASNILSAVLKILLPSTATDTSNTGTLRIYRTSSVGKNVCTLHSRDLDCKQLVIYIAWPKSRFRWSVRTPERRQKSFRNASCCQAVFKSLGSITRTCFHLARSFFGTILLSVFANRDDCKPFAEDSKAASQYGDVFMVVSEQEAHKHLLSLVSVEEVHAHLPPLFHAR